MIFLFFTAVAVPLLGPLTAKSNCSLNSSSSDFSLRLASACIFSTVDRKHTFAYSSLRWGFHPARAFLYISLKAVSTASLSLGPLKMLASSRVIFDFADLGLLAGSKAISTAAWSEKLNDQFVLHWVSSRKSLLYRTLSMVEKIV